ncbi:MAG: DUF2808 domain-containing protein [Anaerolineae bacterium]|nr:DUF2808 domain-containing protein [Gloeobacterales cyanobacterium ES-bin-313]
MKSLQRLLSGALALAIGTLSIAVPASAVTLADGTVYFNHVPDMTINGAYGRTTNAPSVYTFTLSVPANADVGVGRVDIDLGEFGSEYTIDAKKAYVYQVGGDGRRIALRDGAAAASTGPRPTMVSVVLAEPILPGQSAQVQLLVYNTPRIGGAHLLGVTAYPVGEIAHGQFLGFDRVHVWDN